jgi:tRNA 2-thiocytidine biosynthesis protein TtcA
MPAMSEAVRLEKSLLGHMGRAIRDFALIEANDRIMVCVSGGKDSLCMLHLLQIMQQKAPFKLDLVAVTLDQGLPDFPARELEAYFKARGCDYRMLKEDIWSIVLEKTDPEKSKCPLCSRLRRGILYNAAVKLGCNKIALAHHREDLIETLLLNLVFAGSLGSMPPMLESDDGRNTVIRPLCYAPEQELAGYAALMKLPVLPSSPCGAEPNLQRKRMKQLVGELSREIPNIQSSILAAMGNVRTSHLLDRGLSRLLQGQASERGRTEWMQS